MRSAFGDSGAVGAKPPFPAKATPASASAAPRTSTKTRVLRLTDVRHPTRVEGGSRVQLPPGIGPSYEVYVNGVRQTPGDDFDRIGNELVFRRPLAQEGRLGPIRWLSMFLGVAGTYRKHENVDVVYEADGRRTVASLRPGG